MTDAPREPVAIKICGVTSEDAIEAVNSIGAAMIGFNFVEKSPRYVTPERAAELAAKLTPGIRPVALVVEADDRTLDGIVDTVRPDMIQFHGEESPARLAEVSERYALPVMKAIPVASAEDVKKAQLYTPCADWLLFDAKPPKSQADALPGGNGLVFDWQLLAALETPRPWMLSGGLDASNVGQAMKISGARAVDVSSGVERSRGVKDPARIEAFAAAVRAAEKDLT